MEKWFRGGEQGMELWVVFFSFSIFIFYSGLPLRDISSSNIIEKWTSCVP